MNYSLLYSLINFVIYIPVVYFSYRIVKNISEDEDAASAMFFLRENSQRTFKYAALLVATVLIAQILVFGSHYYGSIMKAYGFTLLTVASLGVLYFVRGVFEVTVSPSRAEERDI